jgi:hypothetical protein
VQKKANNFSLALRALRATIAPAALGRTLNAQRAANKRLCCFGQTEKSRKCGVDAARKELSIARWLSP